MTTIMMLQIEVGKL